jgi:outer membrane receptor for ferrienterochelin and colicins
MVSQRHGFTTVRMKSGRSIRGLLGALAVMLVILAPVASAQSTQSPQPPSELSHFSLEQLADLKIDSVYGASRYTQKVTEAPSSVTIITAEEIRRFGHRSVADILRSVRGFYVTYDRNYSFLGVRGFSRPGDYNARVLLLVDGHRLNDNIFGSALIGTEFPVDVELIERVEIIRGPSSSLYGTSAFFAVIDVITKRGESARGVIASGTLGSFGTRKARLTYGHQFKNGVDLFLSGSGYHSDGQRALFFEEFNEPATNNGMAERADADEFTKVFGRLTAGNLTLQAVHGSRTKAIPTASFGTVFNDPRTQTIERLGYIDLQYARRLPREWELGSRVYYDQYGYDGDYVFEYAATDSPLIVVNKDFARGDSWGAELKASKKVAKRQRLAVGAEYRDNFRQNQFNYDLEPFVQYLDDRRASTNWALYAQDEITLHDRLILNVGLRHDHYDSFGGTTNPKLALIYDPLENTTLKFLYGEAFRAPNAYDLFWWQSGVTKANPSLQPETNRTGELVVEQYVGSHVRVAATGFYYRINDLITQETDPSDDLLVYNNIDEINANGFEVEGEGKWPNGIRGRVSYTLQHSQNEHTKLGLTNSPRHLAQVNLLSPVMKNGVAAGVEFQYVGARKTIGGNEVGGVLVSNLTLVGQKLPKGLELSASLFNLGNNKYGDPGSEEHRQDVIVQNGRTFRVNLTYRFPRAN